MRRGYRRELPAGNWIAISLGNPLVCQPRRDLDPCGAGIVSALQRIDMTADNVHGSSAATTTGANAYWPPGLRGAEVGVQLDQIDLHLLRGSRPP